MQVDVDNSVQQNVPYDNVKISHQGIECIAGDGTVKAQMNSQYGFSCWVWENGAWALKNFLDEMGLRVNRLTTPNDDSVYGEIGQVGGTYGIQLVSKNDYGAFFGAYQLLGGGFSLASYGVTKMYADEALTYLQGTNSASIRGGGSSVTCDSNGITLSAPNNSASLAISQYGFSFMQNGTTMGITNDIPPGVGLHVKNGLIFGTY
jgi:hypothetical protein